MADDAATEADRPEQELEYEQLQVEQTRGRQNRERLSLGERWRGRDHGVPGHELTLCAAGALPTPRLTSTRGVSSVALMGCSVVCVSHATASGGEEIGKRVAETLGYLYVDEEIVVRAAVEGGLEPRDIADEERRKSFAGRFLDVLAESGGDAWTLSTPAAATMEGVRPADIRSLIRETVVQTAGRGNVVIVAHAASFALEPGPRTLRVLVTASPAVRAGRIAATEGLDDADARRLIKDSDAGRRDYLKRFYAVDRESPTDYDLIVNTDHLSFEQVAEIILRAADR